MSPDPFKVREWIDSLTKKCAVRQSTDNALINLFCETHKRSIFICEKEVLKTALEALPAVLDAWAEEGAEALFYKRKAADLAALTGSDLPLFEVLSPQEQAAFRSEFRKQVGIR